MVLARHRVRFPTVGVTKKITWKRTTPFSNRCGFVYEVGTRWLDRCEDDADYGIYFKEESAAMTKMISLCHYHTILQESYWIGGEE